MTQTPVLASGRSLSAVAPSPSPITALHIDMKGAQVHVERDGESFHHPFDSAEAFGALSEAWLRCGWDCKHVYSFTWLGRPIIQLPEDLVRLQEVLYRVQPDVIIDIGVAHGGSLVFHAGLCRILDKGRVIGIDIHIRPHNRAAIEAHPLAPLITLIEGDSLSPEVLRQVHAHVKPDDKVMVLLDGCHTYDHVLSELKTYGPLVSVGSYIVAMDGIMQHVAGAPRTQPDWRWNNPRQAAETFVSHHSEFMLDAPQFAFNEGTVTTPVTYWPGGYIKRIAGSVKR